MERRHFLTGCAAGLATGLIIGPAQALSPLDPGAAVADDFAAACGSRLAVHNEILDEIDAVLRQRTGSDSVFQSAFSTQERERLLQLVSCPYCGCAAAEF